MSVVLYTAYSKRFTNLNYCN